MGTRRDFIKGSLAGTAFLGLAGTQALGAEEEGKMIKHQAADISHRLYFFDENGPAKAYGVHHAYAPIKKLDCHVDGADFACVDFGDPIAMDDGSYRCYGTVRPADESTMAVGLWESADALNWKPVNLGEGRNLVHFDNLPGDQSSVGLPNVLRLNDGRWRMYFWKYRDGHLRYLIAESKDGLKWRVLDVNKPALYHPADKTTDPDRKRLLSNDSTHIHYNSEMNRFECYSVWLHPAIPERRVEVDNAPDLHRLIHRRFSSDGLAWSDAELIIMPDDRDPWDLQFYFLSVHRQEGWMIGRLGYYRVADGMQTMDTDLCFSRDGYRWQRPVRGGWIPRSKEGMDSVGIYAAASWLDLGNRWLTLYSGTPVPHNAKAHKSGVMAASFAKNRFVGLSAESTPGGFMTEPFFPAGEEIRVDADIRGSLRAELCNAFGKKLPGFHLMDSVPITGDSESHVLKWKNASTADHRFECLRLRFEYSEGVIYGVSFA